MLKNEKANHAGRKNLENTYLMEDLGSEYIKEPQLSKKVLTDFALKICNGSRHTHPPMPKSSKKELSITSPQEIKMKTTMKYHCTLTRMS